MERVDLLNEEGTSSSNNGSRDDIMPPPPGRSSSSVRPGSLLLTQLFASICGLFSRCFPRRFQVGGRTLVVERKLADGGFSFVYLCRQTSTGALYAVKQILCQSPEMRASVRAEIGVHTALGALSDASAASRRHIEPLLDYSFERLPDGAEQALLVFPLYAQGSLQDRINAALEGAGALFSEPEVLALIVGLGAGLGCLYSLDPPLAHRDLCPRNVMLGDDGNTPVLIDFGSVRPARRKLASRREAVELKEDAEAHCSPPYRAPELWDPATGCTVTEKSDAWSLGALAYACAFGFSPNESQRDQDGRLRIADPTHLRCLGAVLFPGGASVRGGGGGAAAVTSSSGCSFSPAFCDLLLGLLLTDPEQRLSVHAAGDRASALLLGAGGV